MGQNTSANHQKSFRKQKKALKTNGFQGFDGGDKRDRTADLLNAIVSVRWTGCKLRTIRYICAE